MLTTVFLAARCGCGCGCGRGPNAMAAATTSRIFRMVVDLSLCADFTPPSRAPRPSDITIGPSVASRCVVTSRRQSISRERDEWNGTGPCCGWSAQGRLAGVDALYNDGRHDRFTAA